MSNKEKTFEQAAATQEKAVRFLRGVVGDEEKASEIESLSVSEYADRKGLTLINPASHEIQERGAKEMTDEFDDDAGDDAIDPETYDYESERAELEGKNKQLLIDEILAWRECGDRIWAVALPVSEDGGDAVDLADDVMEELNALDERRFPIDDDEEEEAA